MAKLKLKKLPKKPKSSSSISTKENYLKKVATVRKENNRIKALNKKSEMLSKKIAGIGNV